jgi:CRP-like cAMP-binding protein
METSRSEKILLLKSVSLFTESPDPILIEAADLLEEIHYQPEETVFQRGDPGNSMYIIVEGKVKIHDDDMILDYLGPRDFFGEMAALDPEPRSASVTAVEEARLFRIEQAALFDLMQRQPELARGVIHILCQRLRARIKDMKEDFEYMQQFAKVTAAAVAVEAGMYKPESLNEVAARRDELGQLARVFQRMQREVDRRERRLKQEVADLRIESDEIKKARQVAEITETEYFQDLLKKASQLRAGRSSQAE